MERSVHWSICSDISSENRVLSLFPFHRDTISRGASQSSSYYSTFDDTPFDETPLSPLPLEYQDDLAPTAEEELAPPLETVSTSLDLGSSSNKKKPYPADHEARTAFTAVERENAENAEVLDSWDDFREHVCHFLLFFIMVSDAQFFSWMLFMWMAVKKRAHI